MSSAQFVKSIIGNDSKKKTRKGYLAKSEEWQDSLARVMMTGIIKNQFYRSADNVTKEALNLCIKGAKKDPEFVLKTASFARQHNMKGMVKLAIVALAGNAKHQFLNQYRNEIIALLSTFHPGQLLQFVELCKNHVCGKGFGSRPQKWVRDVMEVWTPERLEDFTLKYPKALNNLVRLVHPRYKDKRGKLVCFVLDDKKKVGAGPKQKVVQRLKRPNTRTSTIAKRMIDYNIPWDIVKGFAGMNDENLCMAMMTQMGLSALLLNIRSLEQHGVFNTSEGIKALDLKLNEVKKGRSIPIDFAKPYLYSSNSQVKRLLVQAIIDTLDVPMPEIEDLNIGVSVDISGSMNGEPLITAGLLAVPFLKAKDCWFTTFDTSLYEEGRTIVRSGRGYWDGNGSAPVLKQKSKRKQVEALLNLHPAGGTNTSISVDYALKNQKKLDLHVLITDEQQNTGRPLINTWKEYRNRINPEAQLWIINATNYEWHNADFNDPSIVVYQSMTPAIFRNLKFFGMDLVTEIFHHELKV